MDDGVKEEIESEREEKGEEEEVLDLDQLLRRERLKEEHRKTEGITDTPVYIYMYMNTWELLPSIIHTQCLYIYYNDM